MANDKAAKAPNYTEEQTAALVSAYTGATDQAAREAVVASFAEQFGKGARSIIAKLTREKVYVPKAYTRKDGAKVEKKDTTADAIGSVLKLSEGDTESLTKANRKALQTIFAALAGSEPIENLSEAEGKTKGENVAAIAAALEMSEDEAKSLQRCGAKALGVLAAYFAGDAE